MDFLPEDIDAYAAGFTSAEPEYLAMLNRETHLKMVMPRMLSGHMQGRMLSMFSQMIQPERILEIGTYTGYAALCMAEGLKPGGQLITIDVNPELESMVRKYIALAGMEDRIDFRIGNAMEVIDTISGPLDLVFVDADKENYSHYYNKVLPKVRKGGFIIADNVLWSGKVTGDYQKLDEETRALVDYSRMVHNDPAVEHVLFPVRDGLMIARKK
jgi:predicted O-methyltransferase YrrM